MSNAEDNELSEQIADVHEISHAAAKDLLAVTKNEATTAGTGESRLGFDLTRGVLLFSG